MKQLTLLVIMLVYAATAARSAPDSSGQPLGMDPATVALPEFQVEAPEAPKPLELVLKVPAPRAETLIGEIEPPRVFLAARDPGSEPEV